MAGRQAGRHAGKRGGREGGRDRDVRVSPWVGDNGRRMVTTETTECGRG